MLLGSRMLPGQRITEDTPADLLEGRMELSVVLPSDLVVRMAVERRTPMMDLLIQVTTAHKISPGGHAIQIITEKGRSYVPYKPNTPIGALDAQSIRIVPKEQLYDHSSKRYNIRNQIHNTFQPTFRLQVNLPRNQLAVVRVSKCTQLSEILRSVCEDKNLDPAKYEIRHPGNLSERLSLNSSIGEYDVAGVTVVATSRAPPPQLSASDLLAMRRDDKRAKMRFMPAPFKKSKSSMGESSASSESYGESGGSSSRGASPSRSDESLGRSISPPAPPTRAKKRPAPKPPRPPPPTTNTIQEKPTDVNGNNANDENGCDRIRPVSRVDSGESSSTTSSSIPSRPPSLCTNLQKVSSTSTMSVSSVNKKRRAPAPPPIPPPQQQPPPPPQPQPPAVQQPPARIPVEEPQSSPEVERRSSVDSERSSTVSTPSLASSVSPSPMPPQAESTRIIEKPRSPSPQPLVCVEPKASARSTAPKPACRTNLPTNPPQLNPKLQGDTSSVDSEGSPKITPKPLAPQPRGENVNLSNENVQNLTPRQRIVREGRMIKSSLSEDNLLDKNRRPLIGNLYSDINDEGSLQRRGGSVKERRAPVPRQRTPQPASRKKAPPPPPSPSPRVTALSRDIQQESESDAESGVISDMDANAGSSATSTDDVNDSKSDVTRRKPNESRREGFARTRPSKTLTRWRHVASLHEQEIAYNFSDEEPSLRRLSLSSESTVEEGFQEAIAEGWKAIQTEVEARDAESPAEKPVNGISEEEADSSINWEYTLPEPPTPFKDNKREEKVLAIYNVDSKPRTLVLGNVEKNESSTDPLESDVVVTEVPLQFQDSAQSTPKSDRSSRSSESVKPVQYKTTAIQCSDLPLLDNFSFGSYKKDDDWRNIRCQVESSTATPSTQSRIIVPSVQKKKLEQRSESSESLESETGNRNSRKLYLSKSKEEPAVSTVSTQDSSYSSRPLRKLSRSESFNGSPTVGETKQERPVVNGASQPPVLARGTSFTAPWVVKRVTAFKEPPSDSPAKIRDPGHHASLQNLSSREGSISKSLSLQHIALEEKKAKEETKPAVVKEPAVPKKEVKEKETTEHENLKEEYEKLQAKFMQWQQQILQNQSVIQSKVAPQITSAQVTSMMNEMNDKLSSLESKSRGDEIKTMSLPRPNAQEKVKAVDPPRAATLDRQESTKKYSYKGPPSINLGSWEDRPKARRNVKIEPSNMYRIGRGQKPEAAKLHSEPAKWGTKVTTGNAGTPKGTTVVHLGADTKAPALTKSISVTEQKQESSKADADLQKRFSWQVPTPYSTNIKIGPFKQPEAPKAVTRNDKAVSSVTEITRQQDVNGDVMSVKEVKRGVTSTSIVEVNKQKEVVEVNNKQHEAKMKSRFPNGEADMKVNIYDVIRVPGRSTFRDSTVNAQVTVDSKRNDQSVAPPPPPAPVPPPPAPKVATRQQSTNAIKRRPQPAQDPREELMIAIRNFDQGTKLKQVPGSSTKWKKLY